MKLSDYQLFILDLCIDMEVPLVDIVYFKGKKIAVRYIYLILKPLFDFGIITIKKVENELIGFENIEKMDFFKIINCEKSYVDNDNICYFLVLGAKYEFNDERIESILLTKAINKTR